MEKDCNDVDGSWVPADVVSIRGQYWDRVIWTIGAWSFYCQNGDREFLALALEAVRNSLTYLEENEWDEEIGLFRGGACIADGLGVYGDIYSSVETSGIYQWPKMNPDERHPKGAGLPAMALSSNCLYVEGTRRVGRSGLGWHAGKGAPWHPDEPMGRLVRFSGSIAIRGEDPVCGILALQVNGREESRWPDATLTAQSVYEVSYPRATLEKFKELFGKAREQVNGDELATRRLQFFESPFEDCYNEFAR